MKALFLVVKLCINESKQLHIFNSQAAETLIYEFNRDTPEAAKSDLLFYSCFTIPAAFFFFFLISYPCWRSTNVEYGCLKKGNFTKLHTNNVMLQCKVLMWRNWVSLILRGRVSFLCEPLFGLFKLACTLIHEKSLQDILNSLPLYQCTAVRKMHKLFLKVVWNSHGRDHLFHLLLLNQPNHNWHFW